MIFLQQTKEEFIPSRQVYKIHSYNPNRSVVGQDAEVYKNAPKEVLEVINSTRLLYEFLQRTHPNKIIKIEDISIKIIDK